MPTAAAVAADVGAAIADAGAAKAASMEPSAIWRLMLPIGLSLATLLKSPSATSADGAAPPLEPPWRPRAAASSADCCCSCS